MGKYTILIEELISNSFEIEASSEAEARKIAEAGYRNGEIVLEPGNLLSKRMAVISHYNTDDQWIEF